MPPLLFHISLFLISVFLIFWSGSFFIDALLRIAKFLRWREFVVAFLGIAFAATLPNLFVGISAAFHKIPELSFGDVVSGNLIDLTLVMALAVFFSRGLPAESKLVQTSSIFTIFIAILPLLLILDGILGRGDGIILIFVFAFYIIWLFSKKERYSKMYDVSEVPLVQEFKMFLGDIGRIMGGIVLLLIAAEGIVRASFFFAEVFQVSLALIGILIVGLGNSIPEAYFAIISAKKGQNWMILGNLMGSVIVPATLVLGIVSFISPIEISDSSPFFIARIFLIISALFFFVFVRTDRKISKKEAVFLLSLYILFVILEIMFAT